MVQIAKAVGFFGVWFEYFIDKPEVMREFVAGLTGMASDCFDTANRHKPIPGNAGNPTDTF